MTPRNWKGWEWSPSRSPKSEMKMTAGRVEGLTCWLRSSQSVEQGSGFPLVEKGQVRKASPGLSHFYCEQKCPFDQLRLDVPSWGPLPACCHLQQPHMAEAGGRRKPGCCACSAQQCPKQGWGWLCSCSHLNTAPRGCWGTVNPTTARLTFQLCVWNSSWIEMRESERKQW